MTEQATQGETAVIILAAGQGSRMQSDLPKVLHRLGGVPLMGHPMATARTLEPARLILVAGQTLFERLMGQTATLSVVVEFAGGIFFLFLLLKGRAR